MSEPAHITLAIESAICGGSISLLRDDVEIANWLDSENVSKAEDLLANINTILRSSRVSPHELSLVAVSAGPGSFTGIRIGIATALGLKTGLGVEIASQSALRAMAARQPDHSKIIAALPVGRDAVCLQSFGKAGGELTDLEEPYTITRDDLVYMIQNNGDARFVVHSTLSEKKRSSSAAGFGPNIAYAVGLICRESPGSLAEPLFIRKSF